MRVLHAPVNVGNQPWSLSRAERRLGLKSDLVVNYQTWFGFPADRVLGSLNGRSKKELFQRMMFGWTAPFRYDVLHYYFGRSLLDWDDLPDLNRFSFADLKLARRLGKPVFMTLQGCDVRIAAHSNKRNPHTPCRPGRCSAYETCISTLDSKRLKLIDEILPLCNKVFYLNPELGHEISEGEFLPYANVNVMAIPSSPTPRRDKPVIVHAPSDPKLKGTDHILAALDSLSSRHQFDLILVEGKPHSEAMEIYRTADLAIDQIHFGWYGGFAVELMAMGKPVACYIREEDLAFVPEEMRQDLPILRIHPETLTDDLDGWLCRWHQWREIGSKSREFVEKWHDPDKIAKRMFDDYRNC